MTQRSRSSVRVTLKDVARHAGVSVTTASFVLAGRTDMRVATATADRVLQSANVLGYERSPRKVALNRPRLPVIGLITDTVASAGFGGDMIRGAITGTAERGHGLTTVESLGKRRIEAGLVQDLVDQGVQMFVYCAMATRRVHVPPTLTKWPTVLVNCVDVDEGLPAFVPDERAAGRLAVQTLLDRGHGERIWLVGEVRGTPYAGRERRTAIVSALRAHGLTLARHVESYWWPRESQAAFARSLAQARERPSAVIALNDRVALGVYQAAAQFGLRVPDDLSVVSFDNSELAKWLDPGLTSIEVPYFDMGRRAIDLLVESPESTEVHTLKMPLHERDSVIAFGDRRVAATAAG